MTRGGATAIDLSLANIEKAASVIDPVFLNSPQFVDEQLSAALGTRTIVKVETANPIRSFKGRGADFMLRNFDVRQKAVCASAGNFGQAIAYAGRSRGIAVEVFVPTDANPLKIARMRSFGAKVIAIGSDFDDSKQYARQHVAQNSDCIFVEDGHDPAIAEGAGTIGVELLRAGTYRRRDRASWGWGVDQWCCTVGERTFASHKNCGRLRGRCRCNGSKLASGSRRFDRHSRYFRRRHRGARACRRLCDARQRPGR